MLKHLFGFLLTFSIFLGLHGSELTTKMSEPQKICPIRIILKKHATEALLEVKGSYIIKNPCDGIEISSGILGKRFIIRAGSDGLKWGEAFPGINQFTIIPKHDETKIVLDGTEYDGSVTIYKIGERINIINELSIEDFLKATLSNQFSYPQEEEVLSAAAIAARTTAYFHACKNPKSFWDMNKEQANYHGRIMIAPESPIVKAIDRTKDMILVSTIEGKKLPFAATWTEHSAGKTIPYHLMYRKDRLSPKEGVEAPHASLDRNETKWSYQIPRFELAKTLGFQEITSIETYVDANSSKVYALRIKDANGPHEISFIEFQKKLKDENIQSSEFTISENKQDLIFNGYGKGLGVGICLHSANSMAQNGQSAVNILNKFFPHSELLNLAPSR